MAARDALVSCPTATWTQITDGDASGDISIALFVGPVFLQATTDGTAPTTNDGLPLITPGDGWSEATIAEKFPGVSGAVRLWAYPDRSDSESASIYISHG